MSHLALVLISLALSAAEPAAAPSPPVKDILGGPKVVEGAAEKPTLVHRAFDNTLEDVGPEPDLAAIRLLSLTPQQQARLDEVLTARALVFDEMVRLNYAKIVELAAMKNLEPTTETYLLLSELGRGFAEFRMRRTVLHEMTSVLTADQKAQAEAMVEEYTLARLEQMARHISGRLSPATLRARMTLQNFGQMIRQSIERQVSLMREDFQALTADLALTPQQQSQAQGILTPLALLQLQGRVTPADQARAFGELREILTPVQRHMLFARLVERMKAQPLPHATAQSTGVGAARPYHEAPGPLALQEAMLTWRDESRSRDLPVKIYHPANAAGPRPIVIFSHGLGGTRDGYAYLGRHWASHGYVVVHLQHAGSDQAAFDAQGNVRAALANLLEDPANWIDRARDVSFAITRLEQLNSTGEKWKDTLDLTRIAVAGHSFGAHTVMTMLGALVDLPGRSDQSFRDPRIKAGIAMSPQGAGSLGFDERSWDGVTAPCLYMTGTRDYEAGRLDASGRREAFDHTRPSQAGQLLLTIEDARHMNFGDGRARGPQAGTYHDWIRMTTTAFLDSCLRGEKEAAQWLDSAAIEALSERRCQLEQKKAPAPAAMP